uniref:Uncharacterized protein n=1 Tax=Meloidogyne javanica TaxID=6303 RepID=A0A915LT24_MELJA
MVADVSSNKTTQEELFVAAPAPLPIAEPKK